MADDRDDGVKIYNRCQEKHPGDYYTCEDIKDHDGPHQFVRPVYTKTNPGYVVTWERR